MKIGLTAYEALFTAILGVNVLIVVAEIFALAVLLLGIGMFGSASPSDIALLTFGVLFAIAHSVCLIKWGDGPKPHRQKIAFFSVLPLPGLFLTYIVFVAPS